MLFLIIISLRINNEQMKRRVVIVASKAGHKNLQIARFLNLVRLFVIKVRKEQETAGGDSIAGIQM